jgi:hypothetical protein
MAPFDSGSLTILLSAAADSPGGGHRLPSLTVLWLRCLARPPAGTRTATVSDLPRLLSAARQAAPQLRYLEDCWSADPRLVVGFPAGGQRLRVHPGSHANPVMTLRPVTATAEAIDDFAFRRHGFRLTDLLEVALQYSDFRTGALARAWPAGILEPDRDEPPTEDLGARVRRIARTPVTLTDAEVAAAASAGSADPGEWIAACEYPDQAATAWAWATRSATEANVNLLPGAERLGPVLAVSSQGRDWPVPASLVVSAVAVAAAVLAGEAADDEGSEVRMQLVTARRALTAFGHPIVGAPEPHDTKGEAGHAEDAARAWPAAVMVTVPASRHGFVIGFAGGLDPSRLTRSIREATDAVDGMTASMVVETDPRFDPAGSIFRVVVYGAPVHAPTPTHGGTVCIHVDDLLNAALDADQAATGESIGRELLWQFLDELASMPGVEELTAWDFDDIWQVWLDRGALNTGGRTGVTLYPLVLPSQESWERSAAWEPLEAVLAAAGLPPSWEWSFTRLDEPGQARVGRDGHVFLLLAEPPLIVHVEIGKELAILGIDPAFTLGLAEGVRQTAYGSPGAAAAMSSGDGAPLLIRLGLEPERTPGGPPDAVGCRLAASAGPPPEIHLIFGAEWLEFLAEDPAGGHAVLGRALAEGLRNALSLPEQAGEEFMSSWTATAPVAALRAAETALPPGFQGRRQLPRSPATEARARRSISARIIVSNVPRPALYTGKGAVGLCTDVILPAAEDALAAATADWGPMTLLTVARWLNDARADRARREGELALALTAPWGPHWQAVALDAPEPAMTTRPVELLLETLLASGASGGVDADSFEIAEAADLAGSAISASLSLAATRHRLHDLMVAVDDDGQFAISDREPEAPAAAGIDIGAYLRADRADRTRLRPQPLTGTPIRLAPGTPSEPQGFTPLRDLQVPGSFLAADTVMRRELGTGIDGLRAVLGTAVNWTPNSDDVAETSRDELRDAAIAWSGLTPSEIDAALGLLILTPAQLRQEGLRYSEQERRAYRLATRPLICPGDDRLIIIPRQIEAAQDIYAGYLMNGRLPWPPSEVPRAVSDAFNNYRNRQNRQLERQVLEILSSLGMPHEGNVMPNHAAKFGLRLTGEVDALAADPERSRLWVCEVKDVSAAASPRTLADRVRKFTDNGGYINQLLRSHSEVKANPAAAARLLEVPDPDRDWQVLPLMITRSVEPAAFVKNPAIAFVTSEDLIAVLQADTSPVTGHAGPAETPPSGG